MIKYIGKLGFNGQMSGEAFRAYAIWRSQRGRCNNQKDRSFKNYGAKGIRVEYSSREFVSWWLNQNVKGFTRPNCGRKNHRKNYCFKNIQIEEAADNGRERILRVGNPNPEKKIRVLNRNGKTMFVSNGIRAAARRLGLSHASVRNYLYGKQKSRKGILVESYA